MSWTTTPFAQALSSNSNLGFGDKVLLHCSPGVDQFNLIQKLTKAIDAIPIIALIGGSPMELAQHQSHAKCFSPMLVRPQSDMSSRVCAVKSKRIAEQHNNVVVFMPPLIGFFELTVILPKRANGGGHRRIKQRTSFAGPCTGTRAGGSISTSESDRLGASY